MIAWIKTNLALARAGLVAALLVVAVLQALALRAHLINEGKTAGLAQGRAEVQARWDAQKRVDDAASQLLAQEAKERKEHDDAQRNRIDHDQAQRLAAERRRADAAAAAADGLRGAIAALDRDDLSAAAANPALAGLARRAATARRLLGQCGDQYRAVAEGAGRLRAQVIGLQDFALNVCHAAGAAAQPVPQPTPEANP